MELAFVVSAVRRYLWVVVLGVVLGALPALLDNRSTIDRFQSSAAVLLAPESQVPGAATDRDRYILGQLSVLGSESLAERVSVRLGGELSVAEIRSSVRFGRTEGSDVVTFVVEAVSPSMAQDIVNAYVDEYLTQLQTKVDTIVGPERERLETRLSDLREQLTLIDDQLLEAIRPYLEAEPLPGTEVYPPLPTLEQVAPSLVSSKVVILADLAQLTLDQAAFNQGTRNDIVSSVVERATTPDTALSGTSNSLIAVGLMAGAFVGVFIAVVLARISPRVMGDFEVQDILGHQIVGEMPRSRALATDPLAAIRELPTLVARFVNELCVRIESNTTDDGALTVVVAGARRRAGTTTLATAVAARFAANGVQVLLVDADRRHPQLSRAASGPMAEEETPTSSQLTGAWMGSARPTAMPNLRIVGVSSFEGTATMRRQTAVDLLAQASSTADVIIVDGGPLLGSAFTIHLTRVCSAVVLAIPERQSARSLVEIARELRDRPVLVVWTPNRRRLVGGLFRRSPDQSSSRPTAQTEVESSVLSEV